jgi:hypothetical protein
VKPQVGDGVPSGKLKTGGSWRLSERERERDRHARNGAARQREGGEEETEEGKKIGRRVEKGQEERRERETAIK